MKEEKEILLVRAVMRINDKVKKEREKGVMQRFKALMNVDNENNNTKISPLNVLEQKMGEI